MSAGRWPLWTLFGADLRGVVSGRDFQRLLATRLISQFGDGIFTAGIGTYVFFNRTTFPDPGRAAAAFSVLYLPYSLIGPFAGVFIDRWSRRQILMWSALLRGGFVVLTALLVASGRLGAPLYVSVLAVLGVNRFFLASLSAALPHVVAEDQLVMANALAPTAGTVTSFLGGFAGIGVHFLTSSGRAGSALTLLVAGACYVLAGAAAVTMQRDLLGPPPLPVGAERARILAELIVVVRGLASGARRAWQRRPVAAALGATVSQRAMYGILLLSSILLYRNYFYASASANLSLAHFTLVVIASAAGYGAAAVVTPMVTRRISKAAWISLLLTTGCLVTGSAGPAFTQPGFVIIGLGLGLVAQGVAICTVTIIQQDMGDRYRGRVFALYDMLFNVSFVLGAVIAAQVIPDDGKSYPLIAVASAGYLAAAVAYSVISRQELTGGPAFPAGGGAGSPGPSPPGQSPSRRPSDSATSPSATPQRRSS